MSPKRWDDEVRAGGAKAKSGGGASQFKTLCILLGLLYLGYASFHVFSGAMRGCDPGLTLMVMTPIRELYTIPKIDRAFAESFSRPNANNNPMPGLTIAVGAGMASMIKNSLTLDGCLFVSSFFGMDRDTTRRSRAAPRPTPLPTPFQRHFTERTYAKLTRQSVPLLADHSRSARQKGTCTNPDVLRIGVEYRNHYRVRCAGENGYIEKDFVRLVDGPPSARLIPMTALLYHMPLADSKQIAICSQNLGDIQSVFDKSKGFYRVTCDGKSGWIETKHIEILD